MKPLLTIFLILIASILPARADELRGTGNLGIIIERASGSVVVIDQTAHAILGRIEGLGDLSHASAVFSPDQRYAFIFGRDGGLSKIDILKFKIVNRIMQAGNSIGGAISDDGQLVAVSNYEPGGIKVFHSDTLEEVADIPATYGTNNARSKTVGLVDAPGRKFIYSLYDAGEIWEVDFSNIENPRITKIGMAGKQPYDGLITGDGRHYIAGLFGEDGLAHIDLWQKPLKIERILDHYGRGEKKLPVYKMPHLEGWAKAGTRFILPAVGLHEVLAVDATTMQEVGRVRVHGQPVFAVARPDGRQVWVNFAHPDNDTLQIIDVEDLKIIKELKPGPATLHMEFTPRGNEVWVSVRDTNKVVVYSTKDFSKIIELPVNAPSGIFFTNRSGKIGL